ncbi:hypothetical protein AWC38_SpisGene5605 [Stylophora pistillata]|uniref:Uncharacterized protein n=1 Tax=Stylophora pistillata TaxID=50429 RepID=A0A2B4SKK9_STYPI|nr:hypothetical protein AWC38_SpisGene5605 [Stylophora pistillata]
MSHRLPLEAFLKWELRIESPSLAYAAPTTSTADCRRFLDKEDQGNCLKPKNCHAPRLSGMPKIHKEGAPMTEEAISFLDSGPIGLCATGETAIIYMNDFQLRAMETSSYPLDEWFWYVDDSETKCKEGEAQEILDHLNNIEPGVIIFTKEDQEGDVLPVPDLKQTVNRKTTKIMYSVHYKKTHTNINVKKRSNNPESMKIAIIKNLLTERGLYVMKNTWKTKYKTSKMCLLRMDTPEKQ